MPLYSFSLLDIQKNLASDITLAIPTNLPEGFFFSTGSKVQASGEDPSFEGYYSFTYHRGQDEWIDLQEQSRNSSTCPDEPEYQAAAVGKTLTQQEGTGELRWGGDGWCYILSGTLPRSELEKIAAFVKPVPYRDGVLPPYEYQPPAHPLIRNFSVNRSAIAKDVTITVESLDCTAEACNAVIRLGVASPPSFSVPPGVTAPPVYPDPHAEWRVDGGRLLFTMPGIPIGYRPEGETTLIFWGIEPLPEDSRELVVNFTRVKGITGPWQISIPLQNSAGNGHPVTSSQESPS
jgi:hypothetical protein